MKNKAKNAPKSKKIKSTPEQFEKISQASSAIPPKPNAKERSVSTSEKPSKGSKESFIQALEDPRYDGKSANIPIEFLVIADNIRTEYEDIDKLAHSIEKEGLIQPITVQLLDGEIAVVAGHRRLKAHQLLNEKNPSKFKTISCIMRVGLQPYDRISIQALENLSRSDLSFIEECNSIHELKQSLIAKGYKITNEILGNEWIGKKNRRTIDAAIKIASWPNELKKMIHENEGVLNRSFIYTLAKKRLTSDEVMKLVKEKLEGTVKEPKKNSKHSLSKDDEEAFYLALNKKGKNLNDEVLKELKKSKSWLGSKEARGIMLDLLSSHF